MATKKNVPPAVAPAEGVNTNPKENEMNKEQAFAQKITALVEEADRKHIQAVAFLRDTLTAGPRVATEVTAEAGDLASYLPVAQRHLNISYTGSPWTMRLNQAACIVCDISTDSVEPDHGRPVCSTCTSPIRTWSWHRQREDGKRGWETFKVGHRSDCWRTGANESTNRPGMSDLARMQTCSSVFDRKRTGRPMCDQPVVWKVEQSIGRKIRTSNWCDADLPVDLRPASAEATR